MVVCDPADDASGVRKRPSALFEILSESTRQVDDVAKRAIYRLIPTLEAYIRIEQTKPKVVMEYLSDAGWRFEQVEGLDGVIRLPALEIELPLAELYERVTFDQ